MIIGRASGIHSLPQQGSPRAYSPSSAQATDLPEGCNQFLKTQKYANLAERILSERGSEANSADLALACFEEVAKS
jgi:hypothetical protein